jgi:hypothetical protein
MGISPLRCIFLSRTLASGDWMENDRPVQIIGGEHLENMKSRFPMFRDATGCHNNVRSAAVQVSSKDRLL